MPAAKQAITKLKMIKELANEKSVQLLADVMIEYISSTSHDLNIGFNSGKEEKG